MTISNDVSFFAKCESCKRRRLVVKRRPVILPTGHVAMSQKKICRKCQKTIQKAIEIKK